jgi:hypothetical protein
MSSIVDLFGRHAHHAVEVTPINLAPIAYYDKFYPMHFDSYKSVAIILAFLVPGYVWSATLSYFIPRRTKDAALSFLEFFTLSCVNDSLWLLFYLRFRASNTIYNQPNRIVLLLFSALFISPFGFGWLLGRFSSKAKIASALKVFGWKPVRSIPSAWDYWFGLEKAAFLSVTMTNGSKAYGYFGPGSFAGDGTNEQRDIYLEKIYTNTTQGFQPVDRTAGILINRDQIAYIELYTSTEDSDEQRKHRKVS